mmetsp:Transcript_41576/g.118055  ORF Transcript_41576/g.118055 Transcript_41576/m.118055 type:complete len:208 (+) Transcript_41576:250-873(+)
MDGAASTDGLPSAQAADSAVRLPSDAVRLPTAHPPLQDHIGRQPRRGTHRARVRPPPGQGHPPLPTAATHRLAPGRRRRHTQREGRGRMAAGKGGEGPRDGDRGGGRGFAAADQQQVHGRVCREQEVRHGGARHPARGPADVPGREGALAGCEICGGAEPGGRSGRGAACAAEGGGCAGAGRGGGLSEGGRQAVRRHAQTQSLPELR